MTNGNNERGLVMKVLSETFNIREGIFQGLKYLYYLFKFPKAFLISSSREISFDKLKIFRTALSACL
jgi:hypothetical protein